MNWFEKNISKQKGVFLIAEAGINHNGHFDLALELVKKAKEAGADCVKFQTFRTSASESKHSGKPGYFAGRIEGMTKHEWSRSLELSEEQFGNLKGYCHELDIAFLSTACDLEGLRILERIGTECIKIASSDTNNDYLLAEIGRTKLPVILSTGMSTMREVTHALGILEKYGSSEIALMQCTSQYPTPFNQINLRVMDTFREAFNRPVGFSDHSEGIFVALAAAARGARMIEKHFTLSRGLPGVDHAASLEPNEFAQLVKAVRQIEAALGSREKTVQPEEAGNADSMRRSLMAANPVKAGFVLKRADITAKRPGTGVPPTEIEKFIGKRLKRDLESEDLLSFSDIEQ